MNLFADENTEAVIVDWLRGQGHDVAWAAETAISASDSAILALAADEGRIIVSNDRDIGEKVFVKTKPAAGVLYLRLKKMATDDKLTRFIEEWRGIAPQLAGNFVTLSANKVRVRKLGTSP